MSAILRCVEDGAAVLVSVDRNGTFLHPDEWAAESPIVGASFQPARIGSLLQMYAEDKIRWDGRALNVPPEAIAALATTDLVGLGLPGPCPFVLSVKGSGIVTDRAFNIQVRWRKQDHTPVVGVNREGPFLRVGSKSYTLTNPLFDWLESIGKFNEDQGLDPIERLRDLGQVLGFRAEDVLVEGVMKDMQVVNASAFTVRPSMTAEGQVDFEIVPLCQSQGHPLDGGEAEETADGFEPALPRAHQERFENRFRQFTGAKEVYPTGNNVFLMWPRDVLPALEAVRRIQAGDAGTKLEFVRAPFQVLKRLTAETLPESLVDQCFKDTSAYSARVREIGLWQPKVLPFVRPSGEGWLPPEDGGLRIGSQLQRLSKQQAELILASVREARSAGRAFASAGGVQLPATEEVEVVLSELLEAFDRGIVIEAMPVQVAERWLKAVMAAVQAGEPVARQPEGALPASHETVARLQTHLEGRRSGPDAPRPDPAQRIALLIGDNLESLDYSPAPRVVAAGLAQVPSLVRTELLPHQLAGLSWLQARWAAGVQGAVLADDMGLGKTLTTLSFLCWVRSMGAESDASMRSPVLIVAPMGLLKNWQGEIARHLKSEGLGTVLEAHGAALANLREPGMGRQTEQLGIPSISSSALSAADVVLTTYETVRDFQMSFGRVRWNVLVMDEAQKIKNPAALMTDALKGMNAEFRIAATGTPVENRLQDLWCIADAVEPGCLGSLKSFNSTYEPINGSPVNLEALRPKLLDGAPAPLMLRRMKVDHIEGLPKIEVVVEELEMPLVQAEAYSRAVQSAQSGAGSQGQMLKALQEMRRVSLHPLAATHLDGDMFFSGSARMQLLVKVLTRIQVADERVLIFVNSLEVQALLLSHLQRRFGLKRPPAIINGSVSGPERQKRVDTFQKGKGFDAMLLSPRAGGVGLTLHAANHVVHLDRWWNPAVEDQCTDRVYRIGQEKNVTIYLPLARHPQYKGGSFDVRLHTLLENKRALSRTLLAPVGETDNDVSTLFRETTTIIE